MRQARVWLDNCERNHGATCGGGGETTLPARVIDVSETRLRLYQSSSRETGKYVALSYCRGGPRDFQTTVHTMAERLSGFAIEDLPLTLQDAVTVTRNLGLRYLWVDSVCIIQDNSEDRVHEVSRMAGIYKNAYVTLCAANADAASKSFLRDQADPDTGLWKNMVPLKCSMLHEDAKTTEDVFTMRGNVAGTFWLLDEDSALARTMEDPVQKQGWCLQENILSPRFLSYGRWPSWRCNGGTMSDGGFYLEDRKAGPEARRLTEALLKTRQAPADLFTTNQMHKAWRRVLNDYTKRSAEVEADRLPAIGGIAEEISRITGVEYKAGVWTNNILYDIMWYTDTRDWLSRPKAWRAPTWSWASVNAPVSYGDIQDDATAVAAVHACDASPAHGHTAFGEVQAGSLEISGPFSLLGRDDVLALFETQNLAPPPPKSNNVSEWYMQMLEHMANAPKDKVSKEEAEQALPEKVYGLVTFTCDYRVLHEERREEVCWSGLLLREVEGGRYERIGAFFNETGKWVHQTDAPWDTRRLVLV
jgi:hypothetical protein